MRVDKTAFCTRRLFMSNIENFFEYGDFMVEFDGDYLGCGSVAVAFKPSFLDLRRDALLPPQAKQIRSVDLSVTVQLGSADKFWESLGGCDSVLFGGNIFRKGAVLRLYPADPARQGYEFKRVYLQNFEHISGGEISAGKVKVLFNAELKFSDRNYFVRLEPGLRPAAAQAQKGVADTAVICERLTGVLAGKLGAIPGQTLSMNFFAPPPRGSYALFLERCSGWGGSAAHSFDFKLAARFPVNEKSSVDLKLYQLAQFLHDYRLELGDYTALACRVDALEYVNTKKIDGNTVTDSVLKFTLFC